MLRNIMAELSTDLAQVNLAQAAVVGGAQGLWLIVPEFPNVRE